jgi:pyruvate formate lyase activating enzyme
MKFSGIQKTSLADYPNHVASVLFTPGCNLRCPFCRNWRIVVNPGPPFLSEEDAIRILETRKRFIDSVVVTGGEPTIHRDLPDFLKKLKALGFRVKLDTNGLNSDMLKQCLPNLDYVAVDVKTSLKKYVQLGSTETTELLRTMEILKTGIVDYEFRTTVVPRFVDEDDINEICNLIKGARAFALQQYVAEDTLSREWTTVKPYPSEVLSVFGETAKRYVETVVLRA